MKPWFVVLAAVQLVILSIVGVIRFYLLAQMSEANVADSDYGLFLLCSSISSIVIPFVIGHHIDNGRYREITLWGMLALGSLGLWLLVVPPQNLTLMACSFTLVASCVVVAVQLCLKAAVVEGCINGNLARGNWLNQVVLALSLLIPAGAHLIFYGGYDLSQVLIGMLLVLTMLRVTTKTKLPGAHRVEGSNRHIRPSQALDILKQHLRRSDNLWFVLLLLLMNFATGAIESYVMPRIQAHFGGDGIVYALLGVGCLYFIGSFVSVVISKMPVINGLVGMYVLMAGCFITMWLASSLSLLLVVGSVFFLLHPHIFILTDSRIQQTVAKQAVGTHFSVLRVASFIALSFGNLVVSLAYRFYLL